MYQTFLKTQISDPLVHMCLDCNDTETFFLHKRAKLQDHFNALTFDLKLKPEKESLVNNGLFQLQIYKKSNIYDVMVLNLLLHDI